MLPADKYDIASVEGISKLSSAEIAFLASALLTWLQDGNWPVAEPLASVLARWPQEVLPAVSSILRGDDPIWKYWCIRLLVNALQPQFIQLLKPELETLLLNPSPPEELEGVNLAAQEALAKCAC